MAVTGSSFAIFVGPLVSEKLGVLSGEGFSAVSWVMGATGVYLIRAVLSWLDNRGEAAIDKFVNKAIGDTKPEKGKDLQEYEEQRDLRRGRSLPNRRDENSFYSKDQRPKNPYRDEDER